MRNVFFGNQSMAACYLKISNVIGSSKTLHNAWRVKSARKYNMTALRMANKWWRVKNDAHGWHALMLFGLLSFLAARTRRAYLFIRGISIILKHSDVL